jgi:hypothetical protein
MPIVETREERIRRQAKQEAFRWCQQVCQTCEPGEAEMVFSIFLNLAAESLGAVAGPARSSEYLYSLADHEVEAGAGSYVDMAQFDQIVKRGGR